MVPANLAMFLCAAGDCIVTRNTSQIEPGVVDRRYDVKGIGMFVEVHVREGSTVQLTDCNLDSRCECRRPERNQFRASIAVARNSGFRHGHGLNNRQR